MPMGEFTNQSAEEALEKLREMFNAIAPDQRKDYVYQFSLIGTFIQAAQRDMKGRNTVALQKPVSGSTQTFNED